jgi:hypothetical protein
LQELHSLISNSQMLVKNWFLLKNNRKPPIKKALANIHEVLYPKVEARLNSLKVNME